MAMRTGIKANQAKNSRLNGGKLSKSKIPDNVAKAKLFLALMLVLLIWETN